MYRYKPPQYFYSRKEWETMKKAEEVKRMFSELEAQDTEGAKVAYNCLQAIYKIITATEEEIQKAQAERKAREEKQAQEDEERKKRLCVTDLPSADDDFTMFWEQHQEQKEEFIAIINAINPYELQFFLHFTKYYLDNKQGEQYSRYLQDRIDKAILKYRTKQEKKKAKAI